MKFLKFNRRNTITLPDLISEHGWETSSIYYAAPLEHHKRLRTNNMIERVNQELKRRTKVVRIFPNPNIVCDYSQHY